MRALNALMPEVRRLIVEIKGIKDAIVEVGFEEVPVDEVDDAAVRELAG